MSVKIPMRERLLSRSEERDGCLVWTGPIDRDGYGRVGRRPGLAHRVSYTEFVGPIPEGMTVDHICFRRDCIKPEHLQLLTRRENCSRQRAKERLTCAQGHPWTPESTYRGPGAREGAPQRRTCRKCNVISSARYRAKKKAEAT